MVILDSGMTQNNWPGIMTALWIEHVRNGTVIYREENVRNTLHSLGEEFVLKALFQGGNSPNTYIPHLYYLGLDNRPVITAGDTMSSVEAEPFVNGYSRANMSSSGTQGFTIDVVNGYHRAVSNILSFTASGGGWGPCKNIFLSNAPNSDGTLISSAPLTTAVTLVSGDSVNMRMVFSLRNAPAA